MTEDPAKSLPADPEVEVRLLSGLMQWAGSKLSVLRAHGLVPECFFVPQNRVWFNIICSRHDAGKPIDPILVWEEFESGLFATGREEFVRVATAEPTGHYAEYHAELLREKLALRNLIKTGRELEFGAYQGEDPEELVRAARLAIDNAVRMRQGTRRSRTMSELLEDWESEFDARLENKKISRFPTGLRELDVALGGGLTTSGLTVICGATGAGKTALALQILLNAAVRDLHTLLCSLEMLDTECIERLLANLSSTPLTNIANPGEFPPHDHQLDQIRGAVRKLRGMHARITDVITTSLASLLDELETTRQEEGLDLVIVDYIQLVDGRRSRGENREREVAGISKALHRYGLQSGCVMIAMSQLNDDGAMRESRAIGQDAKTVLNVESEGIRIVKNRQGPGKGSLVPLLLEGDFQRFASRSAEPPEPEQEEFLS